MNTPIIEEAKPEEIVNEVVEEPPVQEIKEEIIEEVQEEQPKPKRLQKLNHQSLARWLDCPITVVTKR